jgi:adenylate cyclase class 1
MLPGFAGKSVPFGLAEYAPTNPTLNAARRLTRSFEFKRRAARSVDILALYLMGSSGTAAYSRKSDFDV